MTRIIHAKWFHKLIQYLKIQQIFRWILQKLSPTFSYKNVKFRIKSPESISIAREIFYEKTYSQFLSENPVKTFVDIGCNTGFFACLLAAYNEANNLEGILIDADPAVLEETKWHLQINNLTRCETMCAIVGPANVSSAEFYVSEFNISSSAIPFDEKYPFPIKTINKIEAPVVDLGILLRSKLTRKRVNLHKIKIEKTKKE